MNDAESKLASLCFQRVIALLCICISLWFYANRDVSHNAITSLLSGIFNSLPSLSTM